MKNVFMVKKNIVAESLKDIINSAIETTTKPPSKVFKYTRFKQSLYALTAVTAINTFALNGIFLYPMLRYKSFRIVLIMLMSLSVGVLSGNAFIHLIPAGFNLISGPNPKAYVPYASICLIGLFSFSFVEMIIKLLTIYRTVKDGIMERNLNPHGHQHAPPSVCKESSIRLNTAMDEINVHETQDELEQFKDSPKTPKRGKKFYSPICFYEHISPYATLIIIGDAVHNFVDGLTIGASFSQSINSGLSVTIAVVSEELPHELGDFAALLSAGLTVWQTCFWNLFSSLSCYLGCLIGLLFGELQTFSRCVDLFCGGIFLYISYCAIFPEILEEAQEISEGVFKRYALLVLICYFWILLGMFAMVGMAYVDINVTV